ncbi:MAG TPA: heavy-metal-associated domain-containing protein [Candidatus Hypogeohydataceae bacterium YC41]
MKTIEKALVIAAFIVGVMFSGVLPFGKPTNLLAEELENVHMDIKGMTCGGCAEKIKSELSELPGVEEGTVNWKKGTADFKVTTGSDHKALVKAIEDAGFQVTSLKCECKGSK